MNDSYLDTTPVRPPPKGQKSNFDDPDSISYRLIIIIAVMSTLVVLLTGARAYTRLRVTKSWGADDCRFSYSMLNIALAALQTYPLIY